MIIGSAVHGGRWLPAAEEYVRRHEDALGQHRVWMFSVGLAAKLHGRVGRRMAASVPQAIQALQETIDPVGYASFAGVWQRAGQSLFARVGYWAIGGREFGDLRDWPAITRWARGIATQLEEPVG